MGIIDGVLGAAGTVYQNWQNKERAREAQSFEQKMWEQSNEYNSPVNQMARLKAAGLNPNLVYGSGNVSGNTATAVQPKSHVPNVENIMSKMENTDPLTLLGRYQDYRQKKLNVDLTGELIKNRQQERLNMQEQNMLIKNQALKVGSEYDFLDKTFVSRHAKIANEALSAEAKGQTDWRLYKEGHLYDTYLIKKTIADMQKTNLELDVDLNKLLKPFGMTTRDDVKMRAAAILLQKDKFKKLFGL